MMDRGKVIIVGAGVGLTALQFQHLKQACEKASLEMVSVIEAMERMAIVSPEVTISVKEFIEVAQKAPNQFYRTKEQSNKQAKEQHKRAIRFYGKK